MAGKKLNVCFVIPSLNSGGIETYLLRFLQFKKEELNAVVLVRSNDTGDLYEQYILTGARIIFKPLGYFSPSSARWYFKFFKNERFETVCDFNANFAGLTMMLSAFANIEKRITFYRQGSDHFNKSVVKKVYNKIVNRLVYKYSTDIFANSKAGLEFFFPQEFPTDKRFKIIRNGVFVDQYLNHSKTKKDFRRELGLPEDAYIVGHTGRFTPAKNHLFLLDVMQLLIKEDRTMHLVLIGNDTKKLLPIIEKLGILENCTILEYQSNIPSFLQAFDLYFFPSLTEGQPNALIEAMISGLPIVASDIPSIRECIEDENANCLVDPYNSQEAAQKLQEIKRNPHLYNHQEYAIQNFDANLQFSEFLNNLYK